MVYNKAQIKELFYHSLFDLKLDKCYDSILKDGEKLELLCSLFSLIMLDDEIREMIFKLKEHDHCTFLHSFHVMILSALFPIGVEKFDMEYMKAALLHDIGKLSISKDILQKNGKLTNDEFELIKSHTVAGFHILENKNMFYCAALARSHHERLDGNGYPDGLFDIEITNETKLLSIFDVFSALTLERPYKPSFSVTQAFEMMEKDESQFDQDLFRQFTKNFCINKKRT